MSVSYNKYWLYVINTYGVVYIHVHIFINTQTQTHTDTLPSMGCANIDVQKLIWYNAKTQHQRLLFASVNAPRWNICVYQQYYARAYTHAQTRAHASIFCVLISIIHIMYICTFVKFDLLFVKFAQKFLYRKYRKWYVRVCVRVCVCLRVKLKIQMNARMHARTHQSLRSSNFANVA